MLVETLILHYQFVSGNTHTSFDMEARQSFCLRKLPGNQDSRAQEFESPLVVVDP